MTPRIETPYAAATRLLELWWRDEQPLHAALQNGSPQAQRQALGEAASYFRVVRSLKRSCDVGRRKPRFEPLRLCLSAVTIEHASDSRFVGATIKAAQSIGASYGGRCYLSAASKLLWIKFLQPFVIYDSVVRKHLGTPPGDYRAYVDAWHQQYSTHESAIKKACAALARAKPSSHSLSIVRPASSGQVAGQVWFQRRVLDILIWHRGA